MKEIFLEFDEEGNVKIEAKGYEGNNCEFATKPFEELYGEKTKKELKPEYKNRTKNKNQQTNRSRI